MFPLCLIFIFSNVVLLSNFFGNDCFIPTFLAHVVLLSNPSGGVSLIPNFHDKNKTLNMVYKKHSKTETSPVSYIYQNLH